MLWGLEYIGITRGSLYFLRNVFNTNNGVHTKTNQDYRSEPLQPFMPI